MAIRMIRPYGRQGRLKQRPQLLKGGIDVTGLEKKQLHDKRKFAAISACSLVVFFGVWHLATAVMHLMPDYCLPSPLQVLEAFIYKLNHKAPDGGTLFQHILASLKVALSGYLLGAVIGIPLGICMAWFRRIDLFVTPLFDLVRPVPTIAWVKCRRKGCANKAFFLSNDFKSSFR